MSDLGERIKGFAQDLTHIEVNTILKPGMTGRKMPAPRHALIEIGKKYRLKLVQLGFSSEDDDINPGCFASFGLIRERAHDGIKYFQKKMEKERLGADEESDLAMLFRIKTMSDQLRGILNAVRLRGVETWDNDFSHEDVEKTRPPLPLETADVVMLRKIWEIGLEEIVMQTIIQLDGDVLTRVQPRFANPESATIHEIHGQSINIALSFWGDLIGFVKDFFQGVFSRPGSGK